MKKKILITLEDWAIDELDRILKSDYCKHRGFKMTRGDVIDELIANFVNEMVDQLNSALDGQESH